MGYIGANIRRERTKAGFDQMRLARALGIDQTAISRFENGSRRPSVELLKKIAVELKCRFAALVSEDEEEYEEINKRIVKKEVSVKDDSDPTRKFVEMLLAKNPALSLQVRNLSKRSDELAPDDWQFLTDHLLHAFRQIEQLLDRKNKK